MSDLVRAIRRREIDRIGSALRGGGGVISVGAEQTRDAIEVMRIALEDARSEYATDFHALASGVVDVGGCADTEEFIVSFVHAVVEVYGDVSPAVSGATRPRDREDQLARLAEYASGRLYRAARQGADLSEGEADLELFADAVDALVLRAQAQSTVLTLVAADEFVEPKGRRRSRFEGGSGLLWTLRSRLQHAGASAYLALIGGPSVIELVADDRAAFYGWGTEVQLRWVPRQALADAVFDELRRRKSTAVGSDSEVEIALDIAELCAGSVTLAQQLIDVLPLAMNRDRDARPAERLPIGRAHRALNMLLELNATGLRQQTRLIKDLHGSALPIARALAIGAAPYAGVKHATDASRALDALRDYGLAIQVEPRQWKLADPLLAAWIRQPTFGGGGGVPSDGPSS